MTASGYPPYLMPHRFAGSWPAGLGKKERTKVVSPMMPCICNAERLTSACQGTPPSGTNSKTKEWRLANAPGLQLSPDIDDILKEGDLPEFFDELLIAITKELHTGRLKNEGW
jgi:hypothetical protein